MKTLQKTKKPGEPLTLEDVMKMEYKRQVARRPCDSALPSMVPSEKQQLTLNSKDLQFPKARRYNLYDGNILTFIHTHMSHTYT